MEHFNRTHGRCDPGVDRIGKLIGIDRSTVLRALSLLHKRGVILRVRHGGRSRRNSYEPNWELLRERHDAWNACFQGVPRRRGEVAAVPPSPSQDCHLAGGTDATQTYLKNLQNKPTAAAPSVDETHVGDRGEARSGLAGKGSARFPALTATHGQSSREAAETAALRRWNADLLDRLRDTPDVYAHAVELIDEALQAAVTAAEMRRHGAGVDLILRSLQAAAAPPGGGQDGVLGNPTSAGVSAPRVDGSPSGSPKPEVEPKLGTKEAAQESPTNLTTSHDQRRVLPGPHPLAVDFEPRRQSSEAGENPA